MSLPRRTQCNDTAQPGALDPELSTLSISPGSFHMHYTKRLQNHLEGYNLEQNKWNIWTTPPLHFNEAKMVRFCSFAPPSLLWGGRGLILPFYSVQDCRSPSCRFHLVPRATFLSTIQSLHSITF